MSDNESDSESITDIATRDIDPDDIDSLDDEATAIVTKPSPETIGIVGTDDTFDYVQTDSDLRIYTTRTDDEEWVQSDTTLEVTQ
jgi:hypothetical protein